MADNAPLKKNPKQTDSFVDTFTPTHTHDKPSKISFNFYSPLNNFFLHETYTYIRLWHINLLSLIQTLTNSYQFVLIHVPNVHSYSSIGFIYYLFQNVLFNPVLPLYAVLFYIYFVRFKSYREVNVWRKLPNFAALAWRKLFNFQSSNEVRFVLYQHAYLYFL